MIHKLGWHYLLLRDSARLATSRQRAFTLFWQQELHSLLDYVCVITVRATFAPLSHRPTLPSSSMFYWCNCRLWPLTTPTHKKRRSCCAMGQTTSWTTPVQQGRAPAILAAWSLTKPCFRYYRQPPPTSCTAGRRAGSACARQVSHWAKLKWAHCAQPTAEQ